MGFFGLPAVKVLGPAILGALLGKLGGGGKVPKNVKRAAGAEAELKEGQLDTAQQVRDRILNRGNVEFGGFPGKLGGGLGGDFLSELANSFGIGQLLGIPGMFSSNGSGIGAAAGLTGQANAIGAQNSRDLGNSLASLFLGGLGSGESSEGLGFGESFDPSLFDDLFTPAPSFDDFEVGEAPTIQFDPNSSGVG